MKVPVRTLLLSLTILFSGITVVVALAPPVGSPETGAGLSQKHCANCHGSEGKGDGAAAALLTAKLPNWADESWSASVSDEDLFKVIKEGGGSVEKSKLMPPFGAKLNDQEISDLVAYIRSLK